MLLGLQRLLSCQEQLLLYLYFIHEVACWASDHRLQAYTFALVGTHHSLALANSSLGWRIWMRVALKASRVFKGTEKRGSSWVVALELTGSALKAYKRFEVTLATFEKTPI